MTAVEEDGENLKVSTIYGNETIAKDAALLGKCASCKSKKIVTCDELVSDEYIRRDPTLTRIFGECVDAVVHCPMVPGPPSATTTTTTTPTL